MVSMHECTAMASWDCWAYGPASRRYVFIDGCRTLQEGLRRSEPMVWRAIVQALAEEKGWMS